MANKFDYSGDGTLGRLLTRLKSTLAGYAKQSEVDDLSEALVNQGETLGNAVLSIPQTLTEAQKAQARANIGATAGEDVEYAESVEWLNQYGDTTKKYVLPDGYIYTYTQKTVTVEHNANDGTMALNVRPKPNGSMTESVANNGIATTSAIEIDPSWTDCIVNISGLTELVENFYATFYAFYYKSDGSSYGYSASSHLGYSATSQTLPVSPDITTVTVDGTWAQTKYVRIAVCIKNAQTVLTKNDLSGLVINFERLNAQKTETGWFSTGIQHSNDTVTRQNSADIAVLKEDVEGLKEAVQKSPSASGAVWYAIGDSITRGLYSTSFTDYFQPVVGQRWVDYVAQYNGYELTNLGVSGSGFVTGTTFRTIVDRNDFSGVDLVTIMLGINDWTNESAVSKVGTMDDDISTGGTIVSELRYGLEKIISDNPYCKIILITPINAKVGSRGTEATNWAYGYTGSITPCGSLKNFNDTLKTVCEYYGIQVVDMTNSSVVNRKSITTVLPDGVHPNLECYKALGLELARRITFA